MNNDIFKHAYLAQLGLIKEDIDTPETSAGADQEVNELKQVTFLTSDPVLIDALNSGFEEVVFFVNAKNAETGEDTIEEVKFSNNSFGEFQISEVEQELNECNEITEEDETDTDEDFDEITEEDETDEVDESDLDNSSDEDFEE